MIPPFDANGNLPPGVHQTTWQEIFYRFGTTPRRQRLLVGLEAALISLQAAGCQYVYIGGSFVTAKENPGDFDACWEPDSVDPTRLDPILLTFEERRAAQKAKYSGELFPASFSVRGTGLTFLQFFQISKETGAPKGIIALDLWSDFHNDQE